MNYSLSFIVLLFSFSASASYLQERISSICQNWNQQTQSRVESIDIDPSRKPAELVLPPSYDSEKRKRPLVVVLHGLKATGPMWAWYLGIIPEFAQPKREALLLVPTGTNPQKQEGESDLSFAFRSKIWESTFWDTKSETVDDKAYLLRLIEVVANNYEVDRSRVYVFGHSNGGFMANKLACEEPEKFAAVASFAGSMLNDYECRPNSPISMLMIHSQDDGLVYYQGGSRVFFGREFSYRSFDTIRDGWLKHNRCNLNHSKSEDIQLMKWRYPSLWTSLGYNTTDTELTMWDDCQGETQVATMVIKSVAHLPGGFFASNRLFSHFPVLEPEAIRMIIDFLFSFESPKEYQPKVL